MASKWHQKKARLAEIDFEKQLQRSADDTTIEVVKPQALGAGDEELFEKKLSKEEKKALAKAKRDAKRKSKKGDGDGDEDDEEGEKKVDADALLKEVQTKPEGPANDGMNHEAADRLASAGTICTFAASRKGIDHSARDINIQNFTMQHMGTVLLDETAIELNHGNRYGLIGRNGSGKSTLLKVIGSRAVPIPNNIDLYYLEHEVEPSDTVTALEAVMSVDEERLRLENHAETLNALMAELTEDGVTDNESGEEEKTLEEKQEEIMEAINLVYERLDAIDSSTAEVRARQILRGLGFTHEMQGKKTKEFSGGWRMRVSLARALFIQPMCLVLDGPTSHLDMEAVFWLEDYLSKWNRILLLVSHSQDFLNQVCTHIIHMTGRKKLTYYDGNYDQFVKTKNEKNENQMKQYLLEQEQIASVKALIARGSLVAKQAQSREKALQKMMRAGLTEKPEEEKPLNFRFSDPGHLPPPVLAFHDVEFGYPGCAPLYSGVSLGIDLDSRVALVGPNGAGKTTLIKLMAGELQPTMGSIRPHGHLKIGRFTQHFVDVLDLDMTPLDYFTAMYPSETLENQRKGLGRYGITGSMQVQKMKELSDGQKSRVVFAKLGRDNPHILLLDEPTNGLDMESIDALAKAVNEYQGGLVLVSQVAKEIWICDNKAITKYKGDIASFKLGMRRQLGLHGEQKLLRGDFSEKVKVASSASISEGLKAMQLEEEKVATATAATSTSMSTKTPPSSSSIAPATTKNAPSSASATPTNRYVPPHLRKKMLEEQQNNGFD